MGVIGSQFISSTRVMLLT